MEDANFVRCNLYFTENELFCSHSHFQASGEISAETPASVLKSEPRDDSSAVKKLRPPESSKKLKPEHSDAEKKSKTESVTSERKGSKVKDATSSLKHRSGDASSKKKSESGDATDERKSGPSGAVSKASKPAPIDAKAVTEGDGIADVDASFVGGHKMPKLTFQSLGESTSLSVVSHYEKIFV